MNRLESVLKSKNYFVIPPPPSVDYWSILFVDSVCDLLVFVCLVLVWLGMVVPHRFEGLGWAALQLWLFSPALVSPRVCPVGTAPCQGLWGF